MCQYIPVHIHFRCISLYSNIDACMLTTRALYTNVKICISIEVYLPKDVSTYILRYIYMCVCVFMYVQICTYLYMYISVYACKYLYSI